MRWSKRCFKFAHIPTIEPSQYLFSMAENLKNTCFFGAAETIFFMLCGSAFYFWFAQQGIFLMKCLRITFIVVILLFSQRFNNIFTFSCHFSLVFFQKRLITSGKVAQCEIFPDTFSLCCVKFFVKSALCLLIYLLSPSAEAVCGLFHVSGKGVSI